MALSWVVAYLPSLAAATRFPTQFDWREQPGFAGETRTGNYVVSFLSELL